MSRLAIAVIVLIGSFLGAMGTLLIKLGVNRFRLMELWKKKIFFVGVVFYILSTLLYLYALSLGSLTFVYPLVSTSYVWTLFFSVHLLGEKMNIWKWVGICGIIVGVVLVGIGS